MISLENTFVLVMTILYTLLQVVCLSIYFGSFMLRRLNSVSFYAFGFILMGLLKLLPNGMTSVNRLLLMILFLIIYVFLSFYGSVFQKLYHIIFFTLIELLADLALFITTNKIFLDGTITHQSYFVANFISFFCVLFIVKMIVTFNANQIIQLKNREYLLLLIIPAFSLVAVCFVARLDDISQLISYFFLIVVNTCATIIYSDLIKRNFMLRKVSLIEAQNKYYRENLENQKELQQMKHDLKNMLINFSYQLEHQQIDRVKTQLEEILNTSPFLVQSLTGYVPLDAILVSKIKEIKENNISYKLDFQVPSDISYDNDIDLVAILGNILDNSIEAVLRLNDAVAKEIKICIKYDKNKLFICVENTSNHIDMNTNKEGLMSDKRTQAFGVGISSIKSRVNKLNGYCDFTYDSGIFSVIVVLPVTYKSEA